MKDETSKYWEMVCRFKNAVLWLVVGICFLVVAYILAEYVYLR